MLAGLIACGVHFTLLYAVATLACPRPQLIEPAFNIQFVSIVITVITLGVLAVFVDTPRFNAPRSTTPDDSRSFLNFVTLALVVMAVIAILWVVLPTTIIADCRT
jgi:hypothetical protein